MLGWGAPGLNFSARKCYLVSKTHFVQTESVFIIPNARTRRITTGSQPPGAVGPVSVGPEECLESESQDFRGATGTALRGPRRCADTRVQA